MNENLLYVRARQLLDAAIETLGDTAPERAYVTVGQPAWDVGKPCSAQLTVNLSLKFGQERAQVAAVLTPVFSIVLLRCVTSITRDARIPNSAAIDEEAMGLYDDAQILVNGITGRWNTRTLFPGVAGANVQFGDLTPQGPSGGLAGWRWDIALTPLA